MPSLNMKNWFNSKNVSRIMLLAIALMPVFSSLQPNLVYADHTCPHNQGFQLYGRDINCGYFLDTYSNAVGSGLLTGIGSPCGTSSGFWEVTNVDMFVCTMWYHLQVGNGCIPDGSANSDQRRNSAAFIVLTMQGAPAGSPANAPCTMAAYSFARWENIVRQYDAAGLADFNPWNLGTTPYNQNTRIQRSTMDVAWYNDTDSQPSIFFKRPGGGPHLYMIKKICANPVGIPGYLPPLTEPLTISCGNTTPATVEVGQPFSLNVNFTTSGGTGPGTSTYTIWIYNFTEAGVPSGAIAALFAPVARSGGTGTGTIPNAIVTTTPVLNTPGVHSGFFRVSATEATNTPHDCPFTITAVAKPYFRAYGGDVFAGAGFTNGLACTIEQTARIIGWNRGSNPYLGAGSQLGTFALGQITDFASGTMRNNTQAKSLTFANANPSFNSWGGGTYGGGLDTASGTANCAPDYYANRTTGTALGDTWNMPSSASGIYSRTGDLTLTADASGLANGQRVTIYVDGNVFVNNNIFYTNNGNYATVADIPRFDLIVRGNIYVAPNVTRLDGVYVAQPQPFSNTTGRFYTCWPGRIPTTDDINGPCRTNRLTVYGAVVAELVKLTRSRGTLLNSVNTERYDNLNGNPAEVFIYTPEVWLTGGIGSDAVLDSINSMPPVL